MPGSLESVRWNAYVHRLDLGLDSHPKGFWGNGVRTHLNSKGKIPSTGGSEEIRTRDAASRRTANPAHYRLSYSRPPYQWLTKLVPCQAPIGSVLGLVGPLSVHWLGELASLVCSLWLFRLEITISVGWALNTLNQLTACVSVLQLLLLLRSQLYLWGSPFLVGFLRMWPFF